MTHQEREIEEHIKKNLLKAQAYCSKSEHCISEVKEKLRQWKANENIFNTVIKFLEEDNYINENRYSKSFTNDRLKFNKWGRQKILAALKFKQIPNQIIKEALNEIDEDDYINILHSIIETKKRELNNKNDFTTTHKIIKFAQSRGFETNYILKELKKESDEYI